MIDKLAAAFLHLAGQTIAAEQACIPRTQAAEMAVSLVPALIDAATGTCAEHLPAGAFLGTGSRALAERLSADTVAVRANAVSMILELTGQGALAPGQDQELMIRTFASGIAGALDPAQCRGASEMIEALAPLPTANIAQAVSAALGIAMAQAGEDGPPICRE